MACYSAPVKIKMVVGELKELDKIPLEFRSRNGFYAFITAIWARVDHDTGELWLGPP